MIESSGLHARDVSDRDHGCRRDTRAPPITGGARASPGSSATNADRCETATRSCASRSTSWQRSSAWPAALLAAVFRFGGLPLLAPLVFRFAVGLLRSRLPLRRRPLGRRLPLRGRLLGRRLPLRGRLLRLDLRAVFRFAADFLAAVFRFAVDFFAAVFRFAGRHFLAVDFFAVDFACGLLLRSGLLLGAGLLCSRLLWLSTSSVRQRSGSSSRNATTNESSPERQPCAQLLRSRSPHRSRIRPTLLRRPRPVRSTSRRWTCLTPRRSRSNPLGSCMTS